MARLKLFRGGAKPREVFFCERCARNGAPSHATVTVTVGAEWRDGRLRGGQRVRVCFFCAMRGEWTPLD